MKSWTRALAIGALALTLSLGLKIAVGVAHGASAPPVPRAEKLRRFLVAATPGSVEAVPGGWRFQSGGCQVRAFPSGERGTLDMSATSQARRRDRIAYVYRGRLLAQPPSFALAMDVIAYTAARPFRVANEPGYVVLIAPKTCAALPALPWDRLPVA